MSFQASEHDLLSLNTPSIASSTSVLVVMGSHSDWATMIHTYQILKEFQVPHECLVVSAHRTPEWMTHVASQAERRGVDVIIAGAGGAAHLPGMMAAQTIIPVLGVPIKGDTFNGLDALYSIVQMPAGVPVATFAIGIAGAKNAALFAVAQLARQNPELKERLHQFRRTQRANVLNTPLEMPL
ncbi:MAG: 5-(carboxyamino)imidazole ribonucleotide mutase [Vampirovibrio sp.]